MEPLATQTALLFLLAIPIACVAWTVTHEEVFREPRELCVRYSKICRSLWQRKFFYLFTCEYCFSHWVTIGFLIMTGFKLMYDDFRGYIISFFSLPSSGGKDDFEIKQLIEARKAKAPLPQNDSSARLPAQQAAKRFIMRKTTGRSVAIQPAREKRAFIRRAGDHLILAAVTGETPDVQKNGSLSIIILY